MALLRSLTSLQKSIADKVDEVDGGNLGFADPILQRVIGARMGK